MFSKTKNKDLHYSINGTITAAEITAAADDILMRYGDKAKIPGFRPGHIPLATLRARYGDGANGEAIDKLMNDDLNKFVSDNKLRLAAAPHADLSKYVAGGDAEYTLEFDVLPTLPEIDLEKFTVTKNVADVPEGEVTKALENLRKSRAQAEKQDEKYKTVDGDAVRIDFKGFVGDTAFAGGEAKNHYLVIGSGSFIPGFEEQLIGHKTGDKFDINVTFPKDYTAELAGKAARFEIEMREVRHHILPALDDELAKSVGMESVAKLTEHIKKILADQYADAARAQMRNELLDILADKVKLNLPESLVAQEYDAAKHEFDEHAGHAHAANDKQGHGAAKGEDGWDEKAQNKDAERRVKLGLILAEWGAKNKVEVTNTDLQNAIWAEASRYPDPQQVFSFYNENPNALSMMRGMLYEQKTMDAMLTHVKMKEKKVSPEDLFKQAEVK